MRPPKLCRSMFGRTPRRPASLSAWSTRHFPVTASSTLLAHARPLPRPGFQPAQDDGRRVLDHPQVGDMDYNELIAVDAFWVLPIYDSLTAQRPEQLDHPATWHLHELAESSSSTVNDPRIAKLVSALLHRAQHCGSMDHHLSMLGIDGKAHQRPGEFIKCRQCGISLCAHHHYLPGVQKSFMWDLVLRERDAPSSVAGRTAEGWEVYGDSRPWTPGDQGKLGLIPTPLPDSYSGREPRRPVLSCPASH